MRDCFRFASLMFVSKDVAKWRSIELGTSCIVNPLSLLRFLGPLTRCSPITGARGLWGHLKGVEISFEVIL